MTAEEMRRELGMIAAAIQSVVDQAHARAQHADACADLADQMAAMVSPNWRTQHRIEASIHRSYAKAFRKIAEAL